MTNFIASSNFTKMMAVIFLFIVLVVAVFVEAYAALAQITLPAQLSTAIWGVLYAGIGGAVSLTSVHVGSTTALSAASQTPQIAAGLPQIAVSPIDPEQTQTAIPAVKRSAA